MSKDTVEKDAKVVKLNEEEAPKELTKEQKAQLKKTEDRLEKLREEHIATKEEFSTKKYPTGIQDKESLDFLINFMENDATWSFTEALGVVEAVKALSSAKIKSKAILLGQLEIEAIYYFFSKHTGTGLKEAETFVKLLKPINVALEKVREDQSKLDHISSRADQLSQVIAGLEQGLEVPAEDLDKILT